MVNTISSLCAPSLTGGESPNSECKITNRSIYYHDKLRMHNATGSSDTFGSSIISVYYGSNRDKSHELCHKQHDLYMTCVGQRKSKEQELNGVGTD
jgi:hypothetical protein